MSIHPESQMGIWLNTSVRFLDAEAKVVSRTAKNDSSWFAVPTDLGGLIETGISKASPSKRTRPTSLSSGSPDALTRLHQNPSRTLYAHVKYTFVSQWVSNRHFDSNDGRVSEKLTTVDLGCSFQLLRRHLQSRIKDVRYIGIDCVPLLYPDILCDLSDAESVRSLPELNPDVVIALDILAELHHESHELNLTLSHWARQFDQNNTEFLMTIPQRYLSENHRLRRSAHDWLAHLDQHFDIVETRGIGFLSALPYLISKEKSGCNSGLLNRMINILKEPMFDSQLLKSLDLLLTRTLGKFDFFKRFSHSLLVVAKVKNSDIKPRR